MSKTEMLTIRLSRDLRGRVDAAISAMPYKPSMTAVVERGLELALREMANMTQEIERSAE